jgi:hypothetical protein
LLDVGGKNLNLVKAGVDIAELHAIKGVSVLDAEAYELSFVVAAKSRLVFVVDHILV